MQRQWRNANEPVKRNVNSFHVQIGHVGEDQMRKTANLMGIKLQGKFEKCEGCARGRVKVARINPLPMLETSRPLERYGMDISSCSSVSIGGKRYWALWVDYASGFTWSMFLKQKNDLVNEGVRFLKQRMREFKHRIFVRCDNSGENLALRKEVGERGMDIVFEMTSPGTPQQNGKVEKKIAVMWDQLRACVYGGGFTKEMRECLFAEILNTLTMLNNIRCVDDSGESPYIKCYG